MLIPPSLLLIIYCVLAEVSIGALFLAAVLPGLLLATTYAVAVVLMASLWLDIRGLFARTERVLQLPNVDRDPIPRWSFGRVTLIGDAAHPMQPVGAQAGSQAVVDARVLAASLLKVADLSAALTHYQDQRIAAMNDIIIRNRNLGLETVLQLAEERAPNGFARITDVLSQDELETTALNFKKAAGLDVDTVNSRDSVLDLARAG
jgi:hypothetical protein